MDKIKIYKEIYDELETIGRGNFGIYFKSGSAVLVKHKASGSLAIAKKI